ncbi:uncharacterized protein EI90DRAFT_3129239 [Cantharellus anzutake]|uniref:uncharacterized protein n=1 Tax=Cantharellus anzutake TaxID=1750568 RepID=UPI001904CCCE|nr:uncharacterized protein EI90DRAFT_3129239 [Cantharellus anzutake]KAF8325106.1 hypothetical protein EI90DRAFT_3129239 [Cantharellus anzutake]
MHQTLIDRYESEFVRNAPGVWKDDPWFSQSPLIITMKYGQDLEFDTEHLEETVAHFHQNHSFEHISCWSFALATHLRACVVRGTEIIDPADIMAEHGQVFCHIHTIPTSTPGSRNSEPDFRSLTSLPSPPPCRLPRGYPTSGSDTTFGPTLGTFQVRPQPRHLPDEYAKPMLPTPDLHSGIPFTSPSLEPPVLAPTSDFDPTSAYTHCIG